MANTLPADSNSILYEGLRDASGTQFVAKQAGTVTTDGGGIKSAPQVVSGTVAANAGTNLNTSLLALEAGGNLATLTANHPAKGQATMANSTPVAIATDQSNVPANIKQVNGATLALGQTTASASLPMVIASDQTAVAIAPPAPSSATYLTSAGRTTTQTQGDQANTLYKGVAVVLDMTVVGTGSVTLEIDVKDPASGKYIALLTGAAVITNVTNVYTVYPGAPVTTNVSANAQIWATWRIKVTANNANSATYTVGYTLLP
jgi:hypothetical protein